MKPFFTQLPAHIAEGTAPGRLDVMGGIADYSGALVLQMPLREAATVRVAFRPDATLRIHSQNTDETFTCRLSDLPFDSYPALREAITALPGGTWAVYVLGCAAVLWHEKALPPSGLDVWVRSDVPLGKGVSSSAALEVATLRALCRLYQLELPGTSLPRLAQRAENLVVGAPCGLMDQLASFFGKRNHLLPIVCQPDAVLPLLPLPDEVHLVGLDSGVRHAVNGASYGQVRTAAFMGYSLVARLAGFDPAERPFGGFLCNIPQAVFDKNYAAHLPETLRGDDFLAQFGQTIDPLSPIDPAVTYAVHACTRHPVQEQARVGAFAETLATLGGGQLRSSLGYRREQLGALGQLMYQSHASYSACGLGHPRTDELVALARQAGPEAGLYGAKITGGGSGGTVCVLAYGAEGLANARALQADFAARHGLNDPCFFE